MTSGTDELHIFYDAQNRPAVVVYNGTAYAYVKSLQGDIVAILDENGNAVVTQTIVWSVSASNWMVQSVWMWAILAQRLEAGLN